MEREIQEINKDKNNLLKTLKAIEDKVNIQEKEIKKLKSLENEINNLKNELKNKNGKITYLEKALKEQKEEIEEITNWKDEYESELEQMQITNINNITLNNKLDSKIIN